MPDRRLEQLQNVNRATMTPGEQGLVEAEERRLRDSFSRSSWVGEGSSGRQWTQEEIKRLVLVLLILLGAFLFFVGGPLLVYVFYLLYLRGPAALAGTALIVVGAVVLAILVVIALMAFTKRRRPQLQERPAQLVPPQVSPDGSYVWDQQHQQWIPIYRGPMPPPR